MTFPSSIPNARGHLRGPKGFPACGTRGSALLIVIILLSIVATLIVSNGIVLGRLKAELELLEKRQTRRLAEPLSATAVPLSRGEDRAGSLDSRQRGQSETSPRPADEPSHD